MSRHVTIQEVVRAQVALLFGKYRPAGGLSPEEQAAVRSERVEFGDRLASMVRAIDAPEAAVIEQVRLVTREVYSDERMRNLPTVEDLCSRVKRSFVTRTRSTCFACVELGGVYSSASTDEPIRAKMAGEIPYEKQGWLCLVHHNAVAWYEQREARRRGLPSVADTAHRFEYPPPPALLPRGARVAAPPADDPKWESWTDGCNMGSVAAWARAFVQRVYGHEVGSTETPLLGEQAPVREESEEWQTL